MSGVSLENGQFGEVIKAENLSSGKTVFEKRWQQKNFTNSPKYI